MTIAHIEDRITNILTVIEYLLNSEDPEIINILNMACGENKTTTIRSEVTDLYGRIMHFLNDLNNEESMYCQNTEVAFALGNKLVDSYLMCTDMYKKAGGEIDTNKILTRSRTGLFLANNRFKKAGVQNVEEVCNT